MSNIIDLKSNPDVLRLIRLVSPKYRKHKAIVRRANQYTNHGSYWDGGSRSSAFLVDAANRVRPVEGPSAPRHFGGGEPVTIDIPAHGAVVVVGTFRGKTATATVVLPE